MPSSQLWPGPARSLGRVAAGGSSRSPRPVPPPAEQTHPTEAYLPRVINERHIRFRGAVTIRAMNFRHFKPSQKKKSGSTGRPEQFTPQAQNKCIYMRVADTLHKETQLGGPKNEVPRRGKGHRKQYLRRKVSADTQGSGQRAAQAQTAPSAECAQLPFIAVTRSRM